MKIQAISHREDIFFECLFDQQACVTRPKTKDATLSPFKWKGFVPQIQWNAKIRSSSDFRRSIIVRFEIVRILNNIQKLNDFVQIFDVRFVDLTRSDFGRELA